MSVHPEFDQRYLDRAMELAVAGAAAGDGGPFGAVLVRDGRILAEGNNRVLVDNDPTAHAEVVTIRRACAALGTFQLDGAQLYSSCEPCPMCLGAVYWARPAVVFFAGTRQDAAHGGFDDEFIYQELAADVAARRIPFLQVDAVGARQVFTDWNAKVDHVRY